MGFLTDYMHGVAMRKNPALLKQRLADIEAQNMNSTIGTLYGEAGQDAVPELMEPQTIETEGPMMPGQARSLMDINQVVQEAEPMIAGSGLIGSAGSPEEARYLQAQKELGLSGFGEGIRQQSARLADMQNSVMGNYGASSRQKQAQDAKLANPSLGRSESELEYFQRDPGSYAKFSAFKKPLVKVDTGMKYPEGRMLSDAESADLGLSTNSSYWLKGDGSAPTKVGNYSEFQTKAANFGNHMSATNDDINSMLSSGQFNPTAVKENLDKMGIPYGLSHFAKSPEGTEYEALKNRWLMAHLRKDSGATLTDSEIMLGSRDFFPIPGDSPGAIKRKAENRARETQGTIAQSGGAYSDLFNKEVSEPAARIQGGGMPQDSQVGSDAWNSRYKELMDKKARGTLK